MLWVVVLYEQKNGLNSLKINNMKKFNLIWGIITLNVLCYFIPEGITQMLVIDTSDLRVKNTVVTFFTYMFMHRDIFHLLNNMIFLYVMGETMLIYIEKYIIVWYYIQIGIIAGILFYLLYIELGIEIKLMGSSAVLFGFLGYLTYIVPTKKVYILGKQSVKFVVFSIAMIVICLVQMAFDYNFGGNMAHLFGYVIGLFLSALTTHIYNFKN
jgi:membrane associated rhomboid family serine protease